MKHEPRKPVVSKEKLREQISRDPDVGTEAGGWFRIVADVRICPKCWAPLAIISDRDRACSYDYDGRADHVCRKAE